MNANSSYQSIDWYAVISGEGPSQGSARISEHYEFEVQPSEFTQLRTGGPNNQWQVDAILFSNGTRFNVTDRPWMRVSFRQ